MWSLGPGRHLPKGRGATCAIPRPGRAVTPFLGKRSPGWKGALVRQALGDGRSAGRPFGRQMCDRRFSWGCTGRQVCDKRAPSDAFGNQICDKRSSWSPTGRQLCVGNSMDLRHPTTSQDISRCGEYPNPTGIPSRRHRAPRVTEPCEFTRISPLPLKKTGVFEEGKSAHQWNERANA